MSLEVQGEGLTGLGRPSLFAALLLAAVSAGLGIAAARSRRGGYAIASARALTASAGFVGLAAAVLVVALVRHDFSLSYVAAYSSRSLSGPYLVAALWAGMEGSLVLWTLLLTGFGAVAMMRRPGGDPAFAGWATAVLSGVALFFLALLVGPADPFTRLPAIPGDGRGLNPLLQSPGMVAHPPLLYTGFVGFSVPFAFGMAALLSGRLDDAWFKATRRWALFAWSALSIGIVLGGAWAYTELGWGGYWAWDPVENASFMPWLTATAYIHSVVVQEKRGMFKVWNVSLILLTYVLAIFGTFLTRSGLLSSVHTFTEGPLGKWFLPFLGIVLVGGLVVVARRLDALRSSNRFDSLMSRESFFLANNVLFLAAAVTVFWGTIYPIVAEVVSGERLSVGPPFFNRAFVPIALMLLLLTGLGPLVSWRKMNARAFVRIGRLPAAAAVATAAVLMGTGLRSAGAVIAFSLCSFTAVAVAGEFVRGSRVYRRRDGMSWGSALLATLFRNRRRYGGYVVHLGVVLIVLGIAGAAGRAERQAVLEPGDAMSVAGYDLIFERVLTDSTPEKDVYTAEIAVRREGAEITSLFPQRNWHKAQRQWQSEIAIRTTPVEDLYLVVTSFDPDGAAAVRAFVNPLTWWIWAGAVVMLGGMAVLLTERRAAPVRAPAAVPVPVVAAR